MTQFNLSYKVSAVDDTKAGLRSALTGFTSFGKTAAKAVTAPFSIARGAFGAARGGLGFLRDFNLGLAPLLRGFESILDSGLKFDAQMKSFQSLTGRSGGNALGLAKSLVAASNGTLTLSRSMQIANRALGSGLGIQQIGTVLDFVSKKAVSTGKNAEQAIDTVVTGLSRGSTLFLDDFGILVDGVDGVRRAFDELNGAGSFDALGPAAQKAAIVNQALVEMRDQTSKIGLTGNEVFFTFQKIKNSLASSVERLVAAVAKSEALRSVLEAMQQTISGITAHFDSGGSFGELLFGKGKSGGLLGLAGAALIDAGKMIATGFMGVVIKLGATLFQQLPNALRFIKNDLFPALAAVFSKAAKELRSEIQAAFAPITEDLKFFIDTMKLGLKQTLKDFGDTEGMWLGVKRMIDNTFGTDLLGVKGEQVSMGGGMLPASSPQMALAQLGAATAMAGFVDSVLAHKKRMRLFYGVDKSPPPPELSDTAKAMLKEMRKEQGKPPLLDEFVNLFKRRESGGASVEKEGTKTESVASRFLEPFKSAFSGFAASLDAFSKSEFLEKSQQVADNLLATAVEFKNFREAFSLFRAEFKPEKADDLPPDQLPQPPKPLTLDERRKKRAEAADLERQIRSIERGAGGVGAEARRRTSARIAMLRKSGLKLSAFDRKLILEEERQAVINERTRDLRIRRAKLVGDINDDTAARRAKGLKEGPGGLKQLGDPVTQNEVDKINIAREQLKKAEEQRELLKRQEELMQQLLAAGLSQVGIMGDAAAELVGAKRRLAAARR